MSKNAASSERIGIEIGNGSVIWTEPDAKGNQVASCDLCSAQILIRGGYTKPFTDHRGRQACQRKQKRNAQVRSQSASVGIAYGTVAGSASSSTSSLEAGMHQFQLDSRRPSPLSSAVNITSLDPLPSSSSVPQVSHNVIANTPKLSSNAPSPSFHMGKFSLSQVDVVSLPPAKPPDACSGTVISWKAGSVLETYPYQRHKIQDLGWRPIAFEEKSDCLRLRSDRCMALRKTNGNDSPCMECSRLEGSSKFRSFVADSSREHKDHTPYDRLNHKQMKQLIQKKIKRQKRLTSEIQILKRQRDVSRREVNDYKRIVVLLSTCNVPGLRLLMHNALKRGSKPSRIFELIKLARDGLYTPGGNFSQWELDIAFIAKSLGGTKLLFAFQRAFRLPSAMTVLRNHPIPQLRVSVARPTAEDLNHNITAHFSHEIRPPPSWPETYAEKPGVEAPIDGVAINTICRYDQRQDSVVGLSRETVGSLSTRVNSLEALKNIQSSLFPDKEEDRKLEFGKEATVVGIAPIARDDHYYVAPIMVSPSDKTENAAQFAEWLQQMVNSWNDHPDGARKWGEIWAVPTDGDSTFRLGKHTLCMVEEPPPFSPLGRALSEMPGLNKLMSKGCKIVSTFDPKHIWKRFATMSRNRSGIQITDVTIRPIHILDALKTLNGMKHSTARELLNPADKQNVPKAVKLTQHLLEIDSDSFNPSAHIHNNAICFLAEVYGNFTLPFITASMSLSEQITRLSTYAHLSCVMWVRHGSAFLTGALYHDTQSIVKHIIITTVRLQGIDGKLRLYIILTGSDRLELVFANVRTLDHSRNFDALQLVEKLSVATLLNATFERNPQLDRGHRRLNITNTLGADHINPQTITADVTVGNVNVPLCFEAGQERANDILERFGMERFDFESQWEKPGHDLHRPCGKWVGVNPEAGDERSEVENIDPILEESTLGTGPQKAPASNSIAGTTVPNQANSGTRIRSDDGLDSDAMDSSSLPPSSPPYEKTILPDAITGPETTRILAADAVEISFAEADGDPIASEISYRDGRLSDEGTSLEDYFPDNEDGSFSIPKFEKTLVIGDKTYSKSFLVSNLLAGDARSKKVTMRTMRSAGVSLVDLHKDNLFDVTALDSPDLIKAGDVAGTLVKCRNKICGAVIELTGFMVDREQLPRDSIQADEYQAKIGKIRVSGEILELYYVGSGWDWTGRYVKLDPDARDERLSTRQFTKEFPATMVHLLGPDLVKPRYQIDDLRPLIATWRFTDQQIQDSVDELWHSLDPDSAEIMTNVELLPLTTNSALLPYRDMEDNECFCVPPSNIPKTLSLTPNQNSAKTKLTCFLCHEEYKASQMRDHVGYHTLKTMRETSDSETSMGMEPCGFCGRDDTCLTQIINNNGKGGSKTVRKVKIITNCPYYYPRWNYRSASEHSKRSPCTNVPIHCPLCKPSVSGHPKTLWKYNAVNHLLSEHSDENEVPPPIPPELLVQIFVSKKEEKDMDIREDLTQRFRDRHEALNLNSEAYDQALLDLQNASDGVESPDVVTNSVSQQDLTAGRTTRERATTVTKTQHDDRAKRRRTIIDS